MAEKPRRRKDKLKKPKKSKDKKKSKKARKSPYPPVFFSDRSESS